MTLYLNGNALNIHPEHYAHLLAFLEAQTLTTGRFAVEVDGTLLPKARLDSTPLYDGMRIEVVQAVGGG